MHVGLIVTTLTSLAFEPMLGIHIAIGFAFGLPVCAHLAQRSRSSMRLVRQLAHFGQMMDPKGRLALADATLAVLTLAMLASGFLDWSIGHPTRIRWHALTGFGLAAYLLVHTLNRRMRLRTSRIH